MDDHHKRLFFEMLSLETVSRDVTTPVKDSDKMVGLLEREFERLGFSTEVIEYEEGFPLVFASLETGARDTVLFLVHYDVVPPGEGWDTNPFTPVERDGKIFARGASDDKGGIIALLMALSTLSEKNYRDVKYNIKVLVLGDEEIGSPHGLCELLERDPQKIGADVSLVMDCGTSGVMVGCSGVLSGTITIHGRGGHSAYPHKASNPIDTIPTLLQKLESFSKSEESRVSTIALAPPESPRDRVWNRFTVTRLVAGDKLNVIPETATLGFNWRFIPEEDPEERKKDLVRLVREWANTVLESENGSFAFSMDLGIGRKGYWTDPENRFVASLANAVARETGTSPRTYCELGATDGIHVHHSLGIPAIGYGPIDEDSGYHGPNEFVRIDTLDRVAGVVSRFLKTQS